SDSSFADHLRTFRSSFSISSNDGVKCIEFPRPAHAVHLQGRTVVFDLSVPTIRKPWMNFCGEMLEWVELNFPLDERINWVLDTFGEYNPVGHGQCMHRSLRGHEIGNRVEVLMDFQGVEDAVKRLGATPADFRQFVAHKPASLQRDG